MAEELRDKSAPRTRRVCSTAGVLIGLLLIGGGAAWGFLTRDPGERLQLTVTPVEVADTQELVVGVAEVRVTNDYAQTVTLIGGRHTCACDPLADLPLRLEPGETRAMHASVRVVPSAGVRAVPLELYTDCKWQPRVRGEVIVNVVSGGD